MILTLEEAIEREEGIVAENERFCAVAPSESAAAYHSATYHRQIAEWLKELAGRKTAGVSRWIDCTEDGYVECPVCGHLTTCGSEDEIEDLHFCFWCGTRLGVDE